MEAGDSTQMLLYTATAIGNSFRDYQRYGFEGVFVFFFKKLSGWCIYKCIVLKGDSVYC